MKLRFILVFFALLSLTICMVRGGDIFLSFLGRKLHIDIAYKNHSGFISCFVLRFVKLDAPIFTLKDFDLTLGSRESFIEPCFSELIGKKTVILKCTIKDASFLGIENKIDNLFPLFKELVEVHFASIYTTLVIYGNTVEIPNFTAYSKDAIFRASGFLTEKGDMNISAKTFFSPEGISRFPEDLKAILTEETNGWFSYSIHIESGKEKPFLRLESDRLRINFEEIQTK